MYIYMHMGRVLQMLIRLVWFFFQIRRHVISRLFRNHLMGIFVFIFFLSFSKFSRLKGSRLHSFGDIIG